MLPCVSKGSTYPAYASGFGLSSVALLRSVARSISLVRRSGGPARLGAMEADMDGGSEGREADIDNSASS